MRKNKKEDGEKMKGKLLINGKELEVEITEKELEKLKTKKHTGYERAEKGECYHTVLDDDMLMLPIDTDYGDDRLRYKIANYYTDGKLAENNARADRLMRQLRRFSVEHRKREIDWNDTNKLKACISYSYDGNGLVVNGNMLFREFGEISFDTKETAQLAIDTFRDELEWYFTEYKDSL